MASLMVVHALFIRHYVTSRYGRLPGGHLLGQPNMAPHFLSEDSSPTAPERHSIGVCGCRSR